MQKLILFIILALVGQTMTALPLETYAANSRLSEGKWVKVSVEHSGLYLITSTQLRQWGFSDPSKVRIYGYGGARIPDELTANNYIDDLPLVQSEMTERGIVFYGVGPESWAISSFGLGEKIKVNNSNQYSDVGYYFLSDTNESLREIPDQGVGEALFSTENTYKQLVQYENDRVSPGEAGYLLVGESFVGQTTRTFKFETPGANQSTSATLECGLVTSNTNSGQVKITVNGKDLDYNNSDNLQPSSTSTYVHGSYSTVSHTFTYEGNSLSITISIPAASSMKGCWLDYLTVSSVKDLALPSNGYLEFTHTSPSLALAGGTTATNVWDVTTPLNISKLNVAAADGGCLWTNDYHTERSYVAWNANASLPSPVYVGNVANQNLHAAPCVDMVIFAIPECMSQAQRLADMHSKTARPLSVAVLNVDEVYNEFASGVPDVSALRKCLKMFYDRGMGADSLPKLGYALLLGRSTYDNRHKTAQFDGNKDYRTIPYWIGGERRSQLSDNTAYGTDDFIAMLEDGSGNNLGIDQLSVAVGRIPVTSSDEAKNCIDKLKQYMEQNKKGTWRNHFMFLADDGDSNVHLQQVEAMSNNLLATENNQAFVSKVYVDAYNIVRGECVGGRKDMFRMLDEGVLWWSFCGHANNHSWTGEKMLTFNDINNMYLSKVPVLMAATCNFLRWDSATLSGGEILNNERYGGTLATISATRPVYISENGYFTQAMGRALTSRDEKGMLPRLGEIYRIAKNNIVDDNNAQKNSTNRLRYVLMGDPALELAMPSNVVRLDSIGGQKVEFDDQVTLMALQRTQLKGSILDPLGKEISDFNGAIEVTLYDAEQSITTKGERDDNIKATFETHGDRLFTGNGKVENGKFTVDIAMPGELAHNFRPATLNMMAYSTETNAEAVGVSRDFYVYGFDETAPIDTISPIIESFVLNHSTFKNGDRVNASPMAIAKISDDVAINMSSAGIGHQMSFTLDGNRSYTDVSMFFTPSSDGSNGGTINYPFEDLTIGTHTLRLRVWDTSGNSQSQEIYFTVAENVNPVIYEVYTDANPARTEANFYIKHDRPDSKMTVTVSVYNLLGRPIWSSTVSGPSDMFTTSPVTWNLTDGANRRVGRGIYLYRASITQDGVNYQTASRRIAVAAE